MTENDVDGEPHTRRLPQTRDLPAEYVPYAVMRRKVEGKEKPGVFSRLGADV